MLFRLVISIVLLSGIVSTASAQRAKIGGLVDSRNLGDRIVVVVPMVGAGTLQDPKRPLFAPTVADRAAFLMNGKPKGQLKREDLPENFPILSYRYEASADGQTAIMEIVGRDAEALAAIRASKRADVKVFELGKATKGEIEAEFRKYKPSFKADDFGNDKAPAPVAGGVR